MKAWVRLAGLLLCSVLHGAEKSPEIKLKFANKEVSFSEIKKTLKEKVVAVYEPHLPEGVSEFVGFSLIELLDTYLGKNWREADGVLTTALDGYNYDISVSRILKYNPTLVYSFADTKREFKFDSPGKNFKPISYGPFVVVWDNINFPQIRREGYYDWTWQVVKLDTIQYASYYANAFPIQNATVKQKNGFEYYKNYCISCHSVSGKEGGKKGSVLTSSPVITKRDQALFKRWVLDPKKIMPGGLMPALNAQLTEPERNEVAELIYEYLVAVSDTTKQPHKKKK
jgi:hypothetical protein